MLVKEPVEDSEDLPLEKSIPAEVEQVFLALK